MTAVESGALEQQVVLLVDSLRQFGGRWANLPIVAVQPRLGPPISRRSRSIFKALDVEFVRENLTGRYSWWNHFNKVTALEYVENAVSTEHVTWLDSDMVVVAEPDDFTPSASAFIARAGESRDVASNGKDDAAEFWHRLCAQFDLNFDRFPLITSFPEGEDVKAYFQTGYYTYKTASRFSGAHRQIFERMLDGDVASKTAGNFHVDQVSAALTVQFLGLDFELCDPRMNFNLNVADPSNADLIPLDEVKIIQYHGSLWSENMRWIDPYLDSLPMSVSNLIRCHAPWTPAPIAARAISRALRQSRSRSVRKFEKRTVRY